MREKQQSGSDGIAFVPQGILPNNDTSKWEWLQKEKKTTELPWDLQNQTDKQHRHSK